MTAAELEARAARQDVMAYLIGKTAFAKHVTFDGPLYLVMRDWGKHGFEGVSYPEQSKRNIIEDIATGQIDRVVSVIEIEDGRATDVTDEIEDAVTAKIMRAA